MLIVVGGEKGGPGKTTIATHIAAMLASAGARALLVNADPQETAQQWAAKRKIDHPELPRPTVVAMRGEAIDEDLTAMADRFDHIVVDGGGHDSVELRASLLAADILLMPLRPSKFDQWTLKKMDLIVRDATVNNRRLVSLVVANQVPPVSRDRARAKMREALEEFPRFRLLDTQWTFRAAYQEAGGEGLTVKEYKPYDAKAAAEASFLLDEVMRHAAEEAEHS